MEALNTCKAALEAGLISSDDYESVKSAWLQSQSLRAAFDAGFMDEGDYQHVKVEFLATLGLRLNGGSSTGYANGSPAPRTEVPRKSPSPAPDAAAAPRRAVAAASPPPPAPPPKETPPPTRRSAPHPAASAPVAASDPPASRGGRSRSRSGSEFYTGKSLPGTSMSGYTIDMGSVDAFNQMRSRSAFPWLLWRIDGSQVVVDRTGSGSYDDFLEALPPTECRYAAYDYSLTSSEGRKLNKLVFLLWTPNSASIKNKMMYSSSKDFFKGQLDGLSCSMQADDLSDISKDDMHQAVVSNLTRK